MLPLELIRARFPGLAGDELLLDNAGGSQILGAVIDEIADYLRTSFVQVGGVYPRSRAAMQRIEAGKHAIAGLFGHGPGAVIIGTSTSQIVFNLAAALAPTLRPGDEIVVTEADHEANVGAWRRLRARGAEIRTWPLDRDTGRLELADLAPLLSPRTRLVCMTHCSNILGTIHDVRAAAELVHRAGAKLFVDGVAYAPHAQVDAAALGVDGYALSIYKIYGPHIAAAYLSPEFFAELDSINHEFLVDAGAYRLQPGGICHELVASCVAISAYFAELGERVGGDPWSAIAAHEQALSARLLAFLTASPRVRVVGETCPERHVRVPTISFTVAGVPSPEIPPRLAAGGIGVRAGDFYARGLVEPLGLQASGGVVRVSLVHYNTLAEVDRLIAALTPIAG